MGKSLYNTLQDYEEFDVDHTNNDGILETAILRLPKWVAETRDILFDVDKLIAWARKYNVLLYVFHMALSKIIINLRAVARPSEIPGVNKGDKIKVSILSDLEAAQKRMEGLKPKPFELSSKKSETEIKKTAVNEALVNQAKSLLDLGVERDKIKASLSEHLNSVEISKIFNQLDSEND